jgi:hypothetical protein
VEGLVIALGAVSCLDAFDMLLLLLLMLQLLVVGAELDCCPVLAHVLVGGCTIGCALSSHNVSKLRSPFDAFMSL